MLFLVVVVVHANLQDSSTNVSEQEEIVSKLTHVLKTYNINPERWSGLSELIGLGLFATHEGSVLLYFHCLTFEELQRLGGLMVNGGLKRILEDVFTQLLCSVTTIVVSLTWSEGDFERSSFYFSSKCQLRVYFNSVN